MKIKLNNSFIIIFCLPLFLLSQSAKQLKLDSLRLQFAKDSMYTYRFKKIRPFFSIDERESSIKNEKGTQKIHITIDGLQAGILLYEKHLIGLGLYGISSQSKKPARITDQNNLTRYQELFINYFTVFYDYTIFNKRFFRFNLPIEIGLGRYVYNLKDETRTKLLWQEKGPMRISGGGAELVLKPLKWIGLKGMIGYRIVVFNKKTNLDLNGLYYSYGVWIDLRQIYRDIKFYGFKRPKYRKNVKAILASEG